MNLRLLQVFLSTSKTVPSPGIFEVSVSIPDSPDEEGQLFCTCPGFKVKSSCKHVRFVRDKMLKNQSNPGVYPMDISVSATDADKVNAKKSLENAREFVLKFGKVEVY